MPKVIHFGGQGEKNFSCGLNIWNIIIQDIFRNRKSMERFIWRPVSCKMTGINSGINKMNILPLDL